MKDAAGSTSKNWLGANTNSNSALDKKSKPSNNNFSAWRRAT